MPENYITLSQLTKTTKGLVNKINAESTVINDTMGDLANLTTTAKSNLVAAINEVASSSGGSSGGITTETDPVFTASAAAGITSTDISNWNAKSTFSGSYNDLTDKPTIPTVPTNVSDFTNDAGYLTSYTETDPTVPAWAKAASKPTYTAAEVGALPNTYTAPVTSVNGQTGAVTLSIPAAQVQSDWNATSGMGVILNKPTIPAATTITNTLASGTLIATINGTNIYAPAYVDADGVSY